MSKAPKGLIYDEETSYILGLTFGLYPESIPYSNIVEDWRIHCASWKWAGGIKVYTAVEKDKNDYEVVRKLAEAINEADFLISHNGNKFDIKKLNTRLIYHRLPPLPNVPQVDTLKEARAIGAFSSNRLDYLGEYLGVGRKLANAPGLWKDAFFGKKSALEAMRKYNIQDVLLLEEVYEELRPYFKTHPNFNSIMGTEDNCPRCGSTHLTKRGYNVTKTGRKQRYQCTDCGAWSESSKLEHTTKVR